LLSLYTPLRLLAGGRWPSLIRARGTAAHKVEDRLPVEVPTLATFDHQNFLDLFGVLSVNRIGVRPRVEGRLVGAIGGGECGEREALLLHPVVPRELRVEPRLGIEHRDPRIELFFGFFLWALRLLALFALLPDDGKLSFDARTVFALCAKLLAKKTVASSGAF
jgi:hypothetical protein